MTEKPRDLKERSRKIFEPIRNTPFYLVLPGIIHGAGLDQKEFERKPLVGIANTWNELNPGHRHLRELANAVKWGVIEQGGIPLEFNTVAPCDGYANGNEGMRYILPQRDIIADSIETMVQAHQLDALVTLSTCDKINPGILMAIVRLDIPSICVPGGPGLYDIHWKVSPAEYKGVQYWNYRSTEHVLACRSCATEGACEEMGTANTTQCIMEAFGMTLPNAATIPAVCTEKYIIAKQSGRQVMELLRQNITPSQIMTRKSLENAIAVDLAIGGSTNAALHLPAIAHEMGIDMDIDIFNEYSKKIPTIGNITPSGDYGISDLYRAGGVPAVMSRIKQHLNLDCLTVSGKTLEKLVKRAEILDDDVIRTLQNPIYPEGGTVVLKGNLAPDGAVVKQSAIKKKEMMKCEGEAIVFDSEKDALDALAANKIRNKQVVVIRYEGPKGGPGMPELLAFTVTLDMNKDLADVAMITDGRFSGASTGPCIGHVSPEAYVGGPIAVVENGDLIKIDIPARRLDISLSGDEIKERLSRWKRIERDIKSKALLKYRALVGSASKGAVLNW
nr:dihydroxy-acid dehydratase [Candidatus Sigynarchaeum springense]